MFGQNIIRPLKQYGHSYGSNANPNVGRTNCGASCSNARSRAFRMEKRLEATLLFLKKKELVALCLHLDLPTGGKKKDLRERILNS